MRAWASAAKWVTGCFLVTRLLALAALYGGYALFPESPSGRVAEQDIMARGGQPPPSLRPLIRWDSAYYVYLARHGYPPAREDGGPVYAAAFFPLYPLSVRAVSWLSGEVFISALVLSNLCAWAAGWMVCLFGSALGSEQLGRRASLLFLAAPGAHFLSLPYSEALFSLLVAAGLWSWARQRPWLAGLLGGLAGATRAPGVVVALVLLVSAWERRSSWRKALPYLGGAGLGGVGLLAYAWFCWRQYADPLYFATLQGEWGRSTSLFGPVQALFSFGADPDYYLVALAALALVVLLFRKPFPWPLRMGALFLLWLPLSTGTLKSLIRLQSTNLPMLAGAASVLSTRAYRMALTGSLLLMLYEAARFGAGYANN